MKQLIVIISLIIFPIALNAQYSKKELKELKKLTESLKINNRGFDSNDDLVPYDKKGYTIVKGNEPWEVAWSTSLFESGFNVGDYSRTNEGIGFNGRYSFEYIYPDGINILDLNNGNKLVCTIRWKGVFGDWTELKRRYILEKLIETNN